LYTSIHANGSENVSSVCAAEACLGPQALAHAQICQNLKNPLKDITSKYVAPKGFALGACTKKVEPQGPSINKGLAFLSNSDLNLLNEHQGDNAQAQSFAYTDSTIQTEHHHAPQHAPPADQPTNQLDGRFSMHQQVMKNKPVLEHLCLSHHSHSSSSDGSEYSVDADGKL